MRSPARSPPRASISACTTRRTWWRERSSAARSGAPSARVRRDEVIGIVGLPNAGKSSLLQRAHLLRAGVEAANYPFTTIEPNIAVVGVRDERLDRIAALLRAASDVVYDTIHFHDIRGARRGRAHRGEGLGNRFLANIRETDAIIHVVRAHDDPNVVHPEGRVTPLSDIETIETELTLADLEQAQRRVERVTRAASRAAATVPRSPSSTGWSVLVDTLGSGAPACTVPPPADAPGALRSLGPLTAKPVLFVVNVDEGSDAEVSPEAALARHAAAVGAGVVAVLGAAPGVGAAGASTPPRPRRCARSCAIGEAGLERVVAGRVLAARADRVLHRGRGQAGAVLAPAPRSDGVARSWGDPPRTSSAASCGVRRGRRSGLAGAARRRRLRRRPRARRPADRGPRLPDARRRRDHRPLHAVAAARAGEAAVWLTLRIAAHRRPR